MHAYADRSTSGTAVTRVAAPAPARQQMERAFGLDPGTVRFDAGPGAGHAVTGLGAEASTRGSVVAFAHGRYRPDTVDGRELIAHELAHVVQQRGGTTGRLASPAALEAQADRAATAVRRGWSLPALSAASPQAQHKVAMRDVGRGEQSGFARVPELIDRLNGLSSGLTFAVDADGFLTTTEIEGGTLNEFDRQMQLFCGDTTPTIPLRFTNRHGLLGDRVSGFHESVFVDAWQSAYVDIDDLLASSDLGLETALVHFIRERQRTKNYQQRIGTATLDASEGSTHRPEFLTAHSAGLDAEQAVLRDFFGDPSIHFIDRDQRIYRNDRRDTIRTKVTQGRGAAGQGVQAISIEVVLHDTRRVISADEYKQILEDERAAAAAAAPAAPAGAAAP
jgi:hypothetical protein